MNVSPHSDGVGRTGTFCCIYAQLERIKTEGVADVFQYIKASRFQRPGLVSNLVRSNVLAVTLPNREEELSPYYNVQLAFIVKLCTRAIVQ